LAAGAESTSDPVALPVAALSHVAVTMHFAGPTAMPTMHVSARQTAYVAAGNQLSAPTMEAAGAIRRDSYYGLAAVETSSTESAKVVVAFGDSMTDGFGSPIDADRRYPNLLDNRLKAAGLIRTGVVNAGIGGNRWIHDFAGPSGNSRFDRDVLALAGVTHAMILMGINDIGFAVEPAPSQEVSAQQIIDSIAAAVSRARASGVRVLLATLLPYEGAGYFSQAGEAKRQTVNAWIRGNPDAAVVDFDLLMRNPADPAALDPAYDSGDHLHPNDAGYAAMAGAVDLALLQ
jgi:lysophospholipase L1-like esterase